MYRQCGCERGGDCTRISVCAAESMVEDAVEELENRMRDKDIIDTENAYRRIRELEKERDELTALLAENSAPNLRRGGE